MGARYQEIFSEYDITECGIRFEDDSEAAVIDTVGTSEETMEVRTVTKQKRNMPWKTRTKATGSGELALSLHIREDLYGDMFGMFVDGYKEGVMVYGTMSVHKQFCMTQKVEDEDGNVKLKAYPCCTVKEGISRKVETNGEEVAEVEMTVSVDPDETGVGMYQVVVEDDTDTEMTTDWMKNFSNTLVLAATEETDDTATDDSETTEETTE